MKTDFTPQQAIVLYTAIEALRNQFARENSKPLEWPDAAGFWWFNEIPGDDWQLVHVRKNPHSKNPHFLGVYSVEGDWGGYTLPDFADKLRGQWVRVEPPTHPK